jgi:hypothetical protein
MRLSDHVHHSLEIAVRNTCDRLSLWMKAYHKGVCCQNRNRKRGGSETTTGEIDSSVETTNVILYSHATADLNRKSYCEGKGSKPKWLQK